jgi:hypothetical protein
MPSKKIVLFILLGWGIAAVFPPQRVLSMVKPKGAAQ